MNVAEVQALAGRIRAETAKAVVGQNDTIDLMLTALFAGGHVLLEGPPGTAKTFLAQCFAQAEGRALAPARSEYAEGLAGALLRTASPGEAIAPVVEEARSLLVLSPGSGAESVRAAALRAGLHEDEADAIAHGASSSAAALAAARGLARINERRGEG